MWRQPSTRPGRWAGACRMDPVFFTIFEWFHYVSLTNLPSPICQSLSQFTGGYSRMQPHISECRKIALWTKCIPFYPREGGLIPTVLQLVRMPQADATKASMPAVSWWWLVRFSQHHLIHNPKKSIPYSSKNTQKGSWGAFGCIFPFGMAKCLNVGIMLVARCWLLAQKGWKPGYMDNSICTDKKGMSSWFAMIRILWTIICTPGNPWNHIDMICLSSPAPWCPKAATLAPEESLAIEPLGAGERLEIVWLGMK